MTQRKVEETRKRKKLYETTKDYIVVVENINKLSATPLMIIIQCNAMNETLTTAIFNAKTFRIQVS